MFLCIINVSVLVYVFFFIFGLVSCYSQSSTNICSIHQNNDHIQDFSDCTKYILCSNGEPTSYSCEDGTKFDSILRLCSYQPVKCFQCPSDTFFIDVPVDYACSQFVRCINGQARHYACDSGLLFDPIRRQCNSKNSVVCPCPAVDFEGFPLFVRDWSDCSRFVGFNQNILYNIT